MASIYGSHTKSITDSHNFSLLCIERGENSILHPTISLRWAYIQQGGKTGSSKGPQTKRLNFKIASPKLNSVLIYNQRTNLIRTLLTQQKNQDSLFTLNEIRPPIGYRTWSYLPALQFYICITHAWEPNSNYQINLTLCLVGRCRKLSS